VWAKRCNADGSLGGPAFIVREGNNNPPRSFTLRTIYPNPFNVNTSIEFEIPEPAKVEMLIYNLIGQQVDILVNDTLQVGYYKSTWNGKDKNGNEVDSGIYFCVLKAKSLFDGKIHQEINKLILIK
jgi:hypothetical protein